MLAGAVTWTFEDGVLARYVMDVTGKYNRSTYEVIDDVGPTGKGLHPSDPELFTGTVPVPWIWNAASG